MDQSLSVIRFFHWNSADADEKAALLCLPGFEVDESPFKGMETIKALRAAPPAAAVIDLSRQPSTGRDVGVLLRSHPATRLVPLLFIEGSGPIFESLKQLLPDAAFTDWEHARDALTEAISNPPQSVIVPKSVFEPYKDVPLAKKLGIQPGARVSLLNAPQGIERTLGELPEGVILTRAAEFPSALTLAFFQTEAELAARIDGLVPHATKGGLWVLNPKKKAGRAAALTQNDVRRIGLSAGLVDYKVCSFDDTWTGLRFTQKGTK